LIFIEYITNRIQKSHANQQKKISYPDREWRLTNVIETCAIVEVGY